MIIAIEVQVIKTALFYQQNIASYMTKTMLGFNPLIKDYLNVSFFLS